MRLIALVLASVLVAGAQSTSDEEFQIYTEPPRLLLRAQRLRLLKRERERSTPRWRQFDMLVAGKAQMPEAAFALALAYVVAGEETVGRQAVQAALGTGSDVRQAAIVYDWCQQLLRPEEREKLEARLKKAARASIDGFAAARNVAFAAIAVGDAEAVRPLVVDWWRGRMAKELMAGTRTIAHADIYPMLELFHVVRDNLQIDLRDDILPVYRDLALSRVLSYYPAVYPAAENEYRIPYFLERAEPDLRIAALTRTAELSLVAYDTNAQEMQFLQGWLMHDRFVLRGAFGAPYEFLWANPYQPGLPFEKMPLYLHDERTGALLIRSSWDDDATWAGVFGKTMQLFREGKPQPLVLRQPLMLPNAALLGAAAEVRFQVTAESPQEWFLVGMKPGAAFDVEVDDEDLAEGIADRGGILRLEFSRADNQMVRVRERRAGK